MIGGYAKCVTDMAVTVADVTLSYSMTVGGATCIHVYVCVHVLYMYIVQVLRNDKIYCTLGILIYLIQKLRFALCQNNPVTQPKLGTRTVQYLQS